MDIDNQDELLVEYDDGDAQMGVDPDAEVIVVEEGDAEMVDEEENIGEFFCLSVLQRLSLTFRR
jgi:hypothetical protein